MYLSLKQHDLFRTLLMGFEVPFRSYIADVVISHYPTYIDFSAELNNRKATLSSADPIFLRDKLPNSCTEKNCLKLSVKFFYCVLEYECRFSLIHEMQMGVVGMLKIKKVLNNNALIAEHPAYDEVILLGKGIGFNKKAGESISNADAEKLFVLKNPEEQEQYLQMLKEIDENFIGVMNDAISFIEDKLGTTLNEHIHTSLTDHLHFALKRLKNGVEIKNPFRFEIELAYPREYAVAAELTEWLEKELSANIPEDEVGFITLHIHSAISKASIANLTKRTQIVSQLIAIAENSLKVTLDRSDINYSRFIRHLHFALDRIESGKYVENAEFLKDVLQKECALCYSIAWKMIKYMQKQLKKKIPEAESVYLTLHLQRLYNIAQAGTAEVC